MWTQPFELGLEPVPALVNRLPLTISYISCVQFGSCSLRKIPWRLSSYFYNIWRWGAAIAQWTHLCLTSCRPGFESQTYNQPSFQFMLLKLYICHLNRKVKRMKINKKRPGFAHFKKKYNFEDWVNLRIAKNISNEFLNIQSTISRRLNPRLEVIGISKTF